MRKTCVIISFVVLLLIGLVACSPSSGKKYYKAGEGDVVSVNYQRYNADRTEKDGGHLVVYLGEGSVPLDLKDRWPDATSVIRGFRMAILGGSTLAKEYGEAMKWYPDDPLRPLDKKEWIVVPPEDGYSSGELAGQSLYFDITLNSIYYDEVEVPFGDSGSGDPWGLDDLLDIPFMLPIILLASLGIVSFVGYKIHGHTRQFLRARVHCDCGGIATMQCARCFTKICRECFLSHGGCAECGSNKMIPLK